ncbi:phospholipid-transporting ATPase ABCA1 isoform X3 [Sitodiplosis mosellana]|uniref:phospholipid-transporting ATPase ABCA1 isoform X3 n=1 Tax=Sitodiplosis mosellana TaxID=263140 RepID=UPI002444F8CD|nr:phospholipid-transporting ATPase ABCA1 isoform X3 [Sitodiplosis mosellana]
MREGESKSFCGDTTRDDIYRYFPANNEDLILYAPNTSWTFRLMENARYRLNIVEERIHAFDNEEELQQFFQRHKNNRNFAVIFTQDGSNGLLNYTIRMRNNNFRTEQIFLNNIYEIATRDIDEYIDSGFLALQRSIDKAYIELSGEQNPNEFKLEFKKFPLNARERKQFIGIKQTGIFVVIIYSFTALLNMILVPMVEEKGCGVKEFLRIASTQSYLNNMTFFFTNLLIGCIIFGATLIVAACYQLLGHVVGIWLVILLFLYLTSAIAFTFLLSVAFDSVYYAKIGGFLCYIAPFLIVLFNDKMLDLILPVFNSAVLLKGLNLIDIYGMKGLVFSFEYLLNRSYGFSMLELYGFLLAHSFSYTMLYFYLSHVFPGRCGTPKPFYFPLMPSYYCSSSKVNASASDNTDTVINIDSQAEVAVKIRGLTKVFKKFRARKNVAVNNLSLDILKNQITVLLGHNGAGKTTTMSMISGIIPKSGGTISIDGEENVDIYRHKIGYCPQHNVYMSYFTCLDHLWFFGRLRGLTPKQVQYDANHLLKKLNLMAKANEYGHNLSGGMKRRLCLGIALIGNTKIAILDEPSSGLDPESRRELWNILLDMRKDHTIFITTHYMEEAEALADKIAIISHGQLLCYGPSIQLKRRFETGYILKLLTNEQTFKQVDTVNLIQQFVPDFGLKSFVKPTLIISLPYKFQQTFPELLGQLEKRQDELGISSISITNSSLEDVFLKSDFNFTNRAKEVQDEIDAPYNRLREEPLRISGFEQFLAIWYKKGIFMRAQWLYWLMLASFPIAAIVISFLSINYKLFNKGDTVSELIDLHIDRITPSDAEILIWLDESLQDRNYFQQSLHKVIESENLRTKYLSYPRNLIENELLYLELENTTHYHEYFPAALVIYRDEETKGISMNVLFSGNSLHSLAATVNLISNFELQLLTNGNNRIKTTNAPMHRNQTKISKSDLDVYAMFMPMAMFFYILFYVSMPFNEERTEFKKMQPISPFIYWTSVFLFDAMIHSLYSYFMYTIHIWSDAHHIFETKEYVMFLSIYMLYGLTYLPIIYMVSQMFRTMSSLYSFLTYMFVIFYIIASFISSSEDNIKTYNMLINVLLIIPDYALSHAINSLLITYVKQHEAQMNFNFDHQYSPTAEIIPETLSYTGTSGPLDLSRYFIYAAAVIAVTYLILINIVESIYRREKLRCFFTFRWGRKKRSKDNQSKTGDIQLNCCSANSSSEVEEEKSLTRTLVREHKLKDYAVIVANLYKAYDSSDVVRGIDFAVKQGECFGLLGINGAGKTTTFKMLTHDTTVTHGQIYINGMSCFDQSTLYKTLFGYCPQVDALNSYMTAYEILKYMAWIRGTPRHRIHREVEKWLKRMDLARYKHVQIKFYSGGTKRKLNTAIAMIAVPQLILLDEPTTGVDPVSRRFMWNCIQDCQKNNKNIVLTSHSMDECEYLCNRLAIMVDGTIRCIGPIQNLKNSFGLGFVIHIVYNERASIDNSENIIKVKESMGQMFNQCKLQEEYAGRLTFIVKEDSLHWSEVFIKIQRLQTQYGHFITDITVNETSLEDIFLQFANTSTNDPASNQNNCALEALSI